MDGLSLKANALKEVFEEAGLRVGLNAYLCDSERDTTVTRFYLARRLGGSPADMGWESQAVHLVPMGMLAAFASHPNDQSVINALQTKGKN
jgi:8-oxo-dGTP pyrophosphatase MutT (NUDIX family)